VTKVEEPAVGPKAGKAKVEELKAAPKATKAKAEEPKAAPKATKKEGRGAAGSAQGKPKEAGTQGLRVLREIAWDRKSILTDIRLGVKTSRGVPRWFSERDYDKLLIEDVKLKG